MTRYAICDTNGRELGMVSLDDIPIDMAYFETQRDAELARRLLRYFGVEPSLVATVRVAKQN